MIVADQQTFGRGRGDRHWHSPVGGLYLSLLLKPSKFVQVTDFSLLAGVTLSQTVKSFVPSEDRVGVKWPNDCLLNGKKVGGVLCEVLGERGDFSVIVGVGLNVNTPLEALKPFEHRPFQATSMKRTSTLSAIKIDDVVERFLDLFFRGYEEYLSKGFGFVQNLWEKECLFIGKKIELRETGLASKTETVGTSIQGIFLGIDERGALVLSQGHGERKSYVTGEITCYWP